MFKFFKKNKNTNKAGFTLIEMMVSVGLFAIVMFISTAVIFSIINGNRKSQSINNVVNNLNFSIESLIRDIKTGYWYNCYDYHDPANAGDGIFNNLALFKTHYMGQSPNGGVPPYGCAPDAPMSHIAFVSTLSGDGQPHVVEYYLVPGTDNTPGVIHKVYYDSGTVVDSPLTTPDIDVKQLDLYISNPPPPPPGVLIFKQTAVQPSVFIIINGNARTGNKDTDVSAFGIQTLISQRLLNI